jgi:hypothetical protein
MPAWPLRDQDSNSKSTSSAKPQTSSDGTERSVNILQLACKLKEDLAIIAEVAIGSGILDAVTLRQQNPANWTSVLRQRTAAPQALEQDISVAPERRPRPRVPEFLRSQISDPGKFTCSAARAFRTQPTSPYGATSQRCPACSTSVTGVE